MKKILSFFLAIMLFAMPVFADNFDLSQMTLEELTELQKMVTLEIANRTREASPFRDDEIGSGEYYAGVDIEAGVYEFVCLYSKVEHMGEHDMIFGSICVSYEDSTSDLTYIDDIVIGQKLKVTIPENSILEIEDAVFLIQPYSHSWAPDE